MDHNSYRSKTLDDSTYKKLESNPIMKSDKYHHPVTEDSGKEWWTDKLRWHLTPQLLENLYRFLDYQKYTTKEPSLTYGTYPQLAYNPFQGLS